jgi:hypothetical protein
VRRLLWQGWTAYVERASGYQSVAVLNALYYAVFGPSVLIARLFGARLLDLDAKPRQSYWLERQPTGKTLESMARHF